MFMYEIETIDYGKVPVIDRKFMYQYPDTICLAVVETADECYYEIRECENENIIFAVEI